MPQVDQEFIDRVWRLVKAVEDMPDAEGSQLHRYDDEFSMLVATQTAVQADLKRLKLGES